MVIRRLNYDKTIRRLAQESGLTLAQSRDALSALSRVLRYDVLRAAREVVIKDVGTFYLCERSARKVPAPPGSRHPMMKLPVTFSVRLRTAKALRER